MYDKKKLEELRDSLEKWEETSLQKTLASMPERRDKFMTTSSESIDRLYTPLDVADLDYASDLGNPGEYPYTRGVHPTLYRGKLWTMRMFAGFGTAEETNARFRYLLEQGQTGLSVAFDLATLMGYDTDQPEALGEFGKCGVAVSSLKDMEILLDSIPLDKVSTSMTINSPAAIIWAMYIAAAENKGVRPDQLRGTIQNDILKEFIAQKEFIFPPEPSMRLVVDTMEYGTSTVPQWNTISISGYHIREAGSTAAQELAFTLCGRHGIRALGHRTRHGCGLVRAAPVVLLQRAQRLLRRNCQIPRCPPHLGARDEGDLRRQESALVAVPLPYADGGCLVDRPAAGEQRGPCGDPGPGSGSGRDPEPAYQFPGRGPGPALGTRSHDCAAHAANHRRKNPGWRIPSIRSVAVSSSRPRPTVSKVRPMITSVVSRNWAASCLLLTKVSSNRRFQTQPIVTSVKSTWASARS